MRPAALCLSQPVDKGASGVGGRFFPARLRAVLWVVERPDRRGERSRGRRHATGAGADSGRDGGELADRSEEHTSELQSLMRISYAVFCLKKKKKRNRIQHTAPKRKATNI